MLQHAARTGVLAGWFVGNLVSSVVTAIGQYKAVMCC